jgi:hypothetical protein
MIATLPSMTNLRPNPLWSELPLFDRTGWERMVFGEFAESIGSGRSRRMRSRRLMWGWSIWIRCAYTSGAGGRTMSSAANAAPISG